MLKKPGLALLALSISTAVTAAPALGAPSHLNKLDSSMRQLVAGKVAHGAGLTQASPTVTLGDRALVDVYVNGDVDAAAAKLRALGMQVKAVSRRAPERIVEGYLPVAAADSAAGLSSTKAILSVMGGGTDTGSVLSQGDAPMHGPQARALGATGAGVTVGVMSDSIDNVTPGVAGSQTTGDLPPNVTVLNDDPSGADEGRAMAEIIYDEAPSISGIVFDTGSTGAADKANHIAELVNNGVNIIADDIFYPSEPMFQDGAVVQAVDAAKAAGVAYFASAGNRARQSWEGTFADGGGGLNDFGGGDTRQDVVNLPAHSSMTVNLQWDEPWGAASDNFDIDVYGNNSFGFTCNANTGFPLEQCGIANSSGSSIAIAIQIHRASGTGSPKLKYIVSDNFGTFSILEHNTNSPAINPDAASARGSLAVAAVCWSTNGANCVTAGLQTPEAFSSRGPVTHTRDANGNLLATPEVRQKPNVAGADGVSTDLSPTSGLNPFFGTSAATPSVAGMAALVKSAKPSLSVDQLYAIITDPNAALDCTSAAGDPDTDCGSGFLQADRAVTEAQDTTAPTIAPALSVPAPDGAHGWYRSPVSLTWSVTDPQSIITARTGCANVSVTTDIGPTAFACSATSIGGTANSSVTIKRDASPPTAPAFSGISAKTYPPSGVPSSSSVKCTATDPTSGVDSCVVSGFGTSAGSHTLSATATNDAGLTSGSTLTYKVGCVVPKLKGKTLSAAKKALKKAGCKLGKTKPKHPTSRYRVKSSSPRAGTARGINAKVNLTFKKK